MEKRIWTKPEMNEFTFAANEYVAAACGPDAGGVVYGFECNAGGGVSGELWNHDRTENYTDNWYHDELGDSTYSTYKACGEKHEASSQDEFVKGWFQTGYGSNKVWTEVFIWFEKLAPTWWNKNPYDIHATENLNKQTWEVLRS